MRNVGVGSAVAIIGFFAAVLEGIRLGFTPLIASASAAVLAFVFIVIWLRRAQRYDIAGHLVLTVVFISMCATMTHAGGFSSPTLIGLFILPIGATVLINVPTSIIWGFIAMVALVGFWVAEQLGANFGTNPGGTLSVLVNRVIVLGGMVVMISVFIRSQRRAELRSRAALRKSQEQAAHLALLKEAAIAANEASSLREALSKCLGSICRTKGWPLAHAYDLSVTADDPQLVRSVLYVDDALAQGDKRLVRDAFRLLADKSTDMSHPDLPPLGHGGRWDSNLADSSNPYRRALAEQLGLSDEVLVMVVIGDRHWILEFFSHTPLERDEAFIDVLHNTGTQLGRVLERTRSRWRIHDLAYSDALTGLPNRRHLNESLEALLAEETRNRTSREGGTDQHIALLQVGIDRFKTINDALGHEVGDKLLKKVADRLLGVVASAPRNDGVEFHATDHVFRVGGDEFTVVLEGIGAPASAAVLAQRILDRLSEPLLIHGREIFTTASLGISISGVDATEGLALLRCADSALAAAKNNGGGRLRFYAASLNEQSSRRLFLENRLRRAINRDELSLAYQPLLCAKKNEIIAAEALLRWTTVDGQRIAPSEFIPIAESTGQICKLGRWVLERACEQLAAWSVNARGPGRVAVNISVEQLREHDFVEFVVALIERFDLKRGALELEITESRLIGSEPEVFEHLEQLRDAGASLALDDFGTGYSSLSQLRRLPIEKLKIDRSFVDGMETDTGNLALVEAVVQIGTNLGLTIVAEGVENEAQAEMLRAVGADELQGFLFSRPVPAEELEASFKKKDGPRTATMKGIAPIAHSPAVGLS